MTDELWIDLETWGNVDIKNGTDNYARGTEIMLFAYALNDEPAKVWDITTGAQMPVDLYHYLYKTDMPIIAHNSRFEESVLAFHNYRIDPSRYRCTMAQALAHGLPGALEKLCEIFKIDDDKAKMKDGKTLVRLFCGPRPKNMKLRRATRETHPEDWKRFVQYCGNDVEAMRAIRKIMPAWNYGDGSEAARRELALWHLDQRINQRGIAIDTELVEGAIVTATRVKEQLAARTHEMTDGAMAATTQRDALLNLLKNIYGLELTDLRGSTVEALLKSDHDLPDIVVELLENRLAASSTSVSKYKRFAQLTGPDGRLRNTLQFCGAARTGRWAGRGVQLQNLPRPVLKQKAIDSGIESIKLDCLDLIDDNPMATLSSAIRGAVIAPKGKKLVIADLSNIEGRMLAFLAGEEWKLQAFRDFDTCMGADGNWYTGDQIRDGVLAGRPVRLRLDKKGEPTRKGHDLYCLAYAKAFRITPEAVVENKKSGDGSMRAIGKVMELALGYSGGPGAFATFAVAYNIDLDDMADNAISSIPAVTLAAAERGYKWALSKKRDFGMRPETYMVCDSFKRLWRLAHPETEGFWKEAEAAFRNAIVAPGKVFTARKIKVVKSGTWVRMVLPSGRSLCYPSPRLNDADKISYMGLNQFSRQWCRLNTYSGKLVENLCQAASRDVIAYAMPEIEDFGYDICVTVHDEDICEAPDEAIYSSDHLAALMANNPAWAAGLPLAAAGFESARYRKD